MGKHYKQRAGDGKTETKHVVFSRGPLSHYMRQKKNCAPYPLQCHHLCYLNHAMCVL